MPVFECVTIGLALSESDNHLIEYASMLAKMKLTGKIQFVHVITVVNKDKTSEQVRQDMQQAALRHFVLLPSPPELTFHVREGVRVDELLKHVNECPCDLFLLGHRRNRSGKRSLAKRLAMISPASVWMVPEDVPCNLSQVIAPIDFSTHSADSLTIATKIADGAGLKECLALHVFFDPSTIRYDEHMDEVRGNEEKMYAEFVKPLDLSPITVQPLFEEASSVSTAIMYVVADKKCDLIVMSTRGRSTATSILLGSETLQVFSESPVPVLAVKHQGAFLNLFKLISSPEMWPNPNIKTN